ncbi:hypothetical protein, partial [Klebsiella pneumoniae]|uniref:hypothetical protein n=1 Tax=Klebsiella pneumoniae TaxID=573 RepID=UPI002FF000D8
RLAAPRKTARLRRRENLAALTRRPHFLSASSLFAACSAKDCRHSAGQRRFAPALFVVAAGACSFPLVPVSPFESIRRG